MTLFALRDWDGLAAVRFAISPLWETQAAVQVLADERGRAYHARWLDWVRPDSLGPGLGPLPAALPRYGYVPDFLAPPPPTSRADIAEQLAQVRATDPAPAPTRQWFIRNTSRRNWITSSNSRWY